MMDRERSRGLAGKSWLAWLLAVVLLLPLFAWSGDARAPRAQAPAPADQIERAPRRVSARQPLPPGTGYLAPASDLSHLDGQRMPRGASPQALPDEFDWRDTGDRDYVTPVRNQGICGSCYAFGFLGSFESRLLIDDAGAFDLSENQAKECNWRELNNFQYPAPGDYWGSCDGGNAFMIASLLAQTGAVLESDDPYVPGDVACKSSPHQKTLLDWRIISADEIAGTEVLKQYLYQYGPIITSMYASSPSFAWYDGSHTLNYLAPPGATDHSVLIVGWSDNLPPVAGSLQPAAGWIVKNSWGTAWGDEGYFTITYGAANIGSWSSYVDNWQHYDPNGDLWYYDNDGWWEAYGGEGGGNTTAWGLASFVADHDTQVTRVEFWTTDAATDVDVYLYADFDGHTLSGLLASKVDLYFTEAGYHSIRLKRPPPVAAGDDVVVVIKFTNASYGYPIAADPHGPVERGRTYLSLSGYSGSWTDMGAVYGTDVAIRVRTSTGAAPAPAVTAITPNSGTNEGVVHITNLAGVHFQPGAAVKLARSGAADIPGAGVAVVSETRITCQFDLTGAAPGAWNVIVTNPDGQSGLLPGGFAVVAPVGPRVDGITPNSGANEGVVHITDLAGAGFQPGAAVKLARSGEPDIPGAGVVVASPSQITCDFDLAGAAPGSWDVVVTNADALSATLPAGFAITQPPAPRVTSIIPSSGTNDGIVHVTDLAGDHFRPGATVVLTRTGQAPVWATDAVVASSTQIMCDLDLEGAATGSWDLIVTNPDGQSGSLEGGFTVTSPTAPVVTGITPNRAPNTGPVHITHLTGDRFQAGATVKLTKPGQPDVAATGVVVVTSTLITCDLNLAGAAAGKWSIEVTNPNTESGVLHKGFMVTSPGQGAVLYIPLSKRAWPAAAVQRLYSVADATVSEGYPLVNLGTMIDMWIGYDHCMAPGAKITRSLIRFDLSGIPAGAAVSRATLHLYLTNSCDPGGPRSYPATVSPATEDWSETSVTWNNQPGEGQVHGSVVIPSRTWGWYAFDVTGLVSGWLDAGAPNYGLVIRGPEDPGNDSGLLEFVTREWPGAALDPYLEVTYASLAPAAGSEP